MVRIPAACSKFRQRRYMLKRFVVNSEIFSDFMTGGFPQLQDIIALLKPHVNVLSREGERARPGNCGSICIEGVNRLCVAANLQPGLQFEAEGSFQRRKTAIFLPKMATRI